MDFEALVGALLGFAGILLVLYTGNRLYGPPTGTFAAAVLAGSPVYVAAAQINTLDMGLSFSLAAPCSRSASAIRSFSGRPAPWRC